ncbi:hypothetical protein EVAR_64903_1 [Eumeta japonica]|uniref:Uncharacterized protein n=1 Tax=Eumeta variegata TaxID=151549 RepID=A0A4C1ZVD7_EUMVA|nr:hypothetical protein EVAR_64903_1 [Eumeta japonica]
MGPPDGGAIPPLSKSRTGRVSTALEKIDTPPLNSIPDVISTTDEIDSAIEGIPYTSSQKSDNSVALDDVEIAECLADSIETQCSHASPPHDIAHVNRIEEEVSTSQGNLATSCQLQTDQPPERSGQLRASPQNSPKRSPPRKGLIIDEQFGFRPAHSCPQQVLRLVGMSVLTRPDAQSEQESRKALPLALLYSAYTDIPRPSSGVQLALFADTALFIGTDLGNLSLATSRGPSTN